jgi:hypothetical protein
MPQPTPSRPAADRNLLFGILALQMDFACPITSLVLFRNGPACPMKSSASSRTRRWPPRGSASTNPTAKSATWP